MITLPGIGPRAQRGGTLAGLLIGLVLGLGVAVAVALFVTHGSLPFVNKVGRPGDRIEPKGGGAPPDPNKPLQGKDRTVAPPPDAAPAAEGKPAETKAAEPRTDEPKAEDTGKSAAEPAPERAAYLLQAGSFKTVDDAEAQRARLALLGYEARVLSADVNGQTVYRVRLGPFGKVDDVNQAKSRLADNGIESAVMRQR
ncbi:MAG: SPOR domain-containing protein [Betaproteobacteria bacterium]|nr:SPOR domain-containing protein [Betaproteobacteria bacterium]